MRKIILLHIILLFSVLAWSQGSIVASGLPYECGFEDGEDLSAWTFNYGTSGTTDQWVVGAAVHSEGRKALYVSSDGQNPVYGNHPNIVVTMLRYRFPQATNTQHYDVSFDWKGVGDSATSKLYVLFCREQDLTAAGATNLQAILSQPNARLSNAQVNVCQSLGESGEKFVCGSEAWQNVSFTNEVNVSSSNSKKDFVFVFIWANENSSEDVYRTSIAIDNFQINTNAIKKPIDLAVYPQCVDSTMLVTWKSQDDIANVFDIQYRKVGESDWVRGVTGISEGPDGYTHDITTGIYSYSLKKILEGSYDVRIRGRYSDSETEELRTNYVYQTNILVYCPENHCINYLNIYDTTKVVCTYGHRYNYHQGSTPYDNIGIIDFGPDSRDSRHTIHVDPTEVDPRTDSLLHTVPPGAMASVRLGNWNVNGEAESITYDITVDTTSQGILIVKYAVVLEHPGSSCGDPGFNMVILDEQGQEVGGFCGKADFSYSSAVEAGWNRVDKPGKDDVAWKDWTTVGINLMGFHGRTLKVRFTTNDCGAGGHYGYAYFVLDCANAHIETENCGNDASLTCVAPEGFAYEWRDENNVIWSHEREFTVDAGLHTYTCKVSFIEEPDCFFEISTVSAPRFPVPAYSYENVLGNCESKLNFTNTSHVMHKWEGTETHNFGELCNEGRWVFRSLITGRTDISTYWAPTYQCRPEGDSIEITYTTYIGANNACDSTRVDTVVVPNIYSEPTEFHYQRCPEEPVHFDGQWFDRDTVYVGHFLNKAGCDSLSTLYLHVYPKAEDIHRHDSICSDQSVIINGVAYNQPLDNYLIMMHTVHGCDSAIYLTLTVNERLQVAVDQPGYACADKEVFYLDYDISAGEYDSLQVAFSTPLLRDTIIYDPYVSSIAIPYPADILPGHYTATLTFYQFCCGLHVEERDIDIRYRSSIVEQKWNDVLTLINPKYNGGYEFTAFQWYKDGMPLEGETRSYLYQPLDTTATYYVVVTREDGVSMATCPIQPVYRPQQSDYPTIVTGGQAVRIHVDKPTKAYIYSAVGQLVNSYVLMTGDAVFQTPAQAGIYIIRYEED